MNSKQNKAKKRIEKKRKDIQDYTFINIESRLYSLLLNFQLKAHFLDTQKSCPDARYLHSSFKNGNNITNI